MPKQKNIEIVEALQKKLDKAKSVLFAEYTGLDANKMNELRKEIRAEGAEITIAKNTLMKLALPKKEIGEKLNGQVMTVFSYEDAVSPLKRLVDFAKEHETPSLKIGLFEGKVTTAEKLAELSQLPSKEELLARVVGGLKSPISGIVNVLGGTQRNFVYALSAIAEKKGEQA
jgi:large subunit ribosomal protein L10